MRLRVIETGVEEYADFMMPQQAEEFTLHIAAITKTLGESRIHMYGHSGPAIEIRRVPDNPYEEAQG